MSERAGTVGSVVAALEQALRSLAEVTATLREVQRQVAELPFEEPVLPVCPACGTLHLPKMTTLAEHIENVHGGTA